MVDMNEILKYWAADREGVSVLAISEIEFDLDDGWPGTDVTPGDLPEVVVKYTVTREVVYRHPVSKLGDFISQLADVGMRGPFRRGG